MCIIGPISCDLDNDIMTIEWFFIWPFLPLFGPLTRHNGQVFLGPPDRTIVENLHSDYVDHQNHYVMKHARNMLLSPFCCPFENFGSAYWACPNSSQALHHAQWLVSNKFHNTKSDLQMRYTISWGGLGA